MNVEKLKKIISDKNDAREAIVLHSASSIIDQIAREQAKIATANAAILELRKELAALEVEQLDPSDILGEEQVPITIKGVRVNDIHVEPNEQGGFKIKAADYSLISSADKVLAKQTIGGYNGMALEPSPATKAALDAFAKSYTADVQALLGLLE